MINSGKKIRALRDKKKILNETKNHNPPSPFKLNGRSLTNLKTKYFVSICFENLPLGIPRTQTYIPLMCVTVSAMNNKMH